MNSARYLILRACLASLVCMTGCLEEHVRTTISPDGSSERTISMKLGQRILPDNAFPVPADSSWSVEWRDISEKDLKFEYVARKRFATPEALRLEYDSQPDTGVIGIRIRLEKRFEWFFTYFDYTETYSYRNPLGNVPVSAYLTASEQARVVAGETSDSLKSKVDRWTSRNVFEEVYRPVIDEARRRNDPALPASLLEKTKEEFFLVVLKVDSLKEAKKDSAAMRSPTTGENVDSAEGFIRLLAAFLHNNAVHALLPAAQRGWSSLDAKLARGNHPAGWVSSVQLPGIILETNSARVTGNTVTWMYKPDQLQVGDYTMHGLSRVTNVWACIVTGVLFILGLMFMIRASFRSRSLTL